MSYILYVIGFVIVIGGMIYGAILLSVPPEWIVVSSIILLGLAIVTGVKATRQKDPSQ
jgi:hydrogenase/urease accessory protein HupE